MSRSNRPWLEQTYAVRRQRTVDLTCSAIAHLKQQGQPVSLASIVLASKVVDREQRGISSSAILSNADARSAYEQARHWRPLTSYVARKRESANPFELHIKVDRNEGDARRRLKRLSKLELIDRLILVEGAFAQLKEKWLEQQNEALQLLMADTAVKK